MEKVKQTRKNGEWQNLVDMTFRENRRNALEEKQGVRLHGIPDTFKLRQPKGTEKRDRFS